jgi:hypothetical protein
MKKVESGVKIIAGFMEAVLAGPARGREERLKFYLKRLK